MRISRRDTIIIAVLVNTGLLAILLMTAIRSENETTLVANNISNQVMNAVAADIPMPPPKTPPPQVPSMPPIDEMDEALGVYTGSGQHEIPLPVSEPVAMTETFDSPIIDYSETQEEYVNVTVKRGDALEKIARMNNTTVDEVKRINRLSNDRLKVGQVLRIPVKKAKTQPKVIASNLGSTHETYYVVQPGDNPWKISRKFQVDYEEILRLNNLDEEKARNLQPGNKIRVR